MFDWIAANLPTILICLALAVIVGLVVFSMVRNKRKGKSSCGGSCAGCAMSGACHHGK